MKLIYNDSYPACWGGEKFPLAESSAFSVNEIILRELAVRQMVFFMYLIFKSEITEIKYHNT